MKRICLMLTTLLFAVVMVSSLCAQQKDNPNPAQAKRGQVQSQGAAASVSPTAPLPQVDAEKQALINNFTSMQNQEARVIVLQQLLNRELGDLRQMQAVFCDQYKLDVEKWRTGAYQYDVKEGKFVEKTATK